MNKKSIAELYQDLPELVAKGILSPETAEIIKRHYGPIEENSSRRTFLLVFGILGVFLVGLGVILLIAHNWAQLTRVNRLMLSIGLLGAAQVTAGMTLYFKPESQIWRESTATLHTLVIGAVLALVGQTYHLTGDTDMFMLTWMLLSMPLIYVLRASSVAVIYIVGVTFWCISSYSQWEKQFVWSLLALAAPFYWRLMRQDRESTATAILSWVGNISLYACFTAVAGNSLETFKPLIYNSLFSLNYIIGVLWFNPDRQNWRMPFKAIGLVGSVISIFIMTFHDYWRHLQLAARSNSVTELLLVLFLLSVVVAAVIRLLKQANSLSLLFSVAPIVVSSAYLCQFVDASGISATILLNSYLLLLSIWVITTGIRRHRIGQMNVGMLLLGLLIVARFLDANLSFVIRGIIFVILGIGFLLINWLMVRRRSGGQHEK